MRKLSIIEFKDLRTVEEIKASIHDAFDARRQKHFEENSELLVAFRLQSIDGLWNLSSAPQESSPSGFIFLTPLP